MYSLKEIEKNDGRVFIVGDLHGCYSLLMESLQNVSFDFEKDLVIATGDLIDRGTENVKCLELMSEDWFESVLGNHDEVAYYGVTLKNESYYDFWYGEGGHWFYYLKGSDHYQWAKELIGEIINLPHIIELTRNNKKYIICHADYPRATYSDDANLSSKEIHALNWNRGRLDQYLDKVTKEEDMFIDGADQFFFGHTPLTEVSSVGNCTYVDTGMVISKSTNILVNVDDY